jgi:hypothetical protein
MTMKVKRRVMPLGKDLRSLKAVNVAGVQYGEFADELAGGVRMQTFCGSPSCVCHRLQEEEVVLPKGTIVRLVREDQNLYDPLAIRINDEATGRMIGYVPRSQNGTLARLMDAGYPMYGAILTHNHKLPISDFKRIQVGVYIERARTR